MKDWLYGTLTMIRCVKTLCKENISSFIQILSAIGDSFLIFFAFMLINELQKDRFALVTLQMTNYM